MQTVQIEVRPLSPLLGAEISGIDASRELPEPVRERLRELWHGYALLLLRGQNLDEDDQVRFAGVFGKVSTAHGRPRGFSYVSNVYEGASNPAGGLGFHVDHSYLAEPLRGLMLYCLETPPEGEGGETLFVDAMRAYHDLPPALRARVDGLIVRHGEPIRTKRVAMPGVNRDPDSCRSEHPLIGKHPVTGEPYVFLSRRHADCILGLSEEEGEALMDELGGYLYRPEQIVAHAWRPGDVVVWDNLRLQHGRNTFDHEKWKRHMRRVQIGPRETAD